MSSWVCSSKALVKVAGVGQCDDGPRAHAAARVQLAGLSRSAPNTQLEHVSDDYLASPAKAVLHNINYLLPPAAPNLQQHQLGSIALAGEPKPKGEEAPCHFDYRRPGLEAVALQGPGHQTPGQHWRQKEIMCAERAE